MVWWCSLIISQLCHALPHQLIHLVLHMAFEFTSKIRISQLHGCCHFAHDDVGCNFMAQELHVSDLINKGSSKHVSLMQPHPQCLAHISDHPRHDHTICIARWLWVDMKMSHQLRIWCSQSSPWFQCSANCIAFLTQSHLPSMEKFLITDPLTFLIDIAECCMWARHYEDAWQHMPLWCLIWIEESTHHLACLESDPVLINVCLPECGEMLFAWCFLLISCPNVPILYITLMLDNLLIIFSLITFFMICQCLLLCFLI